jgi:DNA-binding NtrC family response regulator
MTGTQGERDLRKRILFVDDEPAILVSLQKLLRKDSMRWDMVFALGGRRALDEIRRVPFDVVVSDMKMPEIDGATLLHVVKTESPATMRILLTGYSDAEVLACALPVLHQLLNKPCSIAALRDAIECCIDDGDE